MIIDTHGIMVALITFMFGVAHSGAFAQNPTVAENAVAGTKSWRITKAAALHQLEGYASLTSINKGGSIQFFVSTTDPSYTITVYRMGFYQGLGGRQGTQPVTLVGHQQAIPDSDPATGLIECQWSFPYTLTVPTTWVSGEYLAKLSGSSGEQSYIRFVVRDDTRVSDIVAASPTNTAQASNNWGGKSLYCNSDSRPVSAVTKNTCASTHIPAVKINYNRPYQGGWGAGDLFLYEYYLIYWLEGEGYDLTYTTNVDTHNATGLFSSSGAPLHKAFIPIPHDDYWSYEMRQNVTALRDKGVGLAILGADTSFWQIRYRGIASDGSGAAHRRGL